MERTLPGTTGVEGREFLYVEYPSAWGFRKAFFEIARICPSVPKDGGIITEESSIVLPDGLHLHGISYNGDLAGWRRCIMHWCKVREVRWGKIDGTQVLLSSGECYSLDHCKCDIR